MHSHLSPRDLSPEQRLHELASLLACGVLRLRRYPAVMETSSRELSVLAGTGLEVPDETRLSVLTIG